MKNVQAFPQLVLRLALGVGFIIPVLDRLGFLGTAESGNAAWGNWENFAHYTHTLMPFLNFSIANVLAIGATIAEVVFGICLIIGFKIRFASFGSALLTLAFGVSMAIFSGIAAPFKYPVFVFVGAGLVLSCVREFKWSIDYLLHEKDGDSFKDFY